MVGKKMVCLFMELEVQESRLSIRLSQFIKMSMKYMDLRNVNCLFFMKYQSTTLLQKQSIHVFLTSSVMQRVEKMGLLVSYFGNAQESKIFSTSIELEIPLHV